MGDPLRGGTEQDDQRGRRGLNRKFADTSVLLGFLDGHPACVDALQGGEWVTTHAHLLEVYSVLLGRPEVPANQPQDILKALLPLTVQVPHDAVHAAAEIRRNLRARGRDCSYFDSLGYGVAQSLDVPLLIADESFEGVHGATRIPLEPGATRKRSRR